LYVGDLANEVTEAMLYEKFSAVGPLSTIRVCRDAITRRSLGYAYVNFTYPADANRALDIMNYETIKGRPCRIMWSQRDPSVRRSGLGNVFIKNLDESIDHKALYDTFSAFGNIISCKVSMDQDGKSRGHGFVHYEKQAEADSAITNVNGMELVDKIVFVGPWKSKGEMVAHYQAKNANFRNVYVKNIPNGTSEEDFDKLFAEYGTITSRVLRSPPREGAPGEEGTENTMYGFVCYEKPEEAAEAVAKRNGYEMGEPKLALYVARAQKKKERQENIKRQRQQNLLINQTKFKGVNLFIKNLDDHIDDAQLRAAFEPYGSIISAKVMKDMTRNVSRGYGFVNFSSHEEATKTVTEMHGNMMDGNSKPLYVAIAQRKEDRVHHLAMQRAQLAQNRSATAYGYQGNMMGFPQQQHLAYMGQPVGRGGFPQQVYSGPRGQPGSGQPGNARPQAMVPMYPQQAQYQPYGNGQMNSMQIRNMQQQQMQMQQQQQQPMGMPMGVAGGPGGNSRNMVAGSSGSAQRGTGSGANSGVRGGATRGGKQGGAQGTRQTYSNTNTNAVMRQGVRNAPTNLVTMGGAPMVAGEQPQATAAPSFTQVLSTASPEEQKQMLGEKLFEKICTQGPRLDQERSAKITGMLLEMDNTELLHLLEDHQALNDKVEEAQIVLRDAQNVQ
jgi:polyadenylate-binding protein